MGKLRAAFWKTDLSEREKKQSPPLYFRKINKWFNDTEQHMKCQTLRLIQRHDIGAGKNFLMWMTESLIWKWDWFDCI